LVRLKVQEAISQPIPDGSSESDDAALMCSSSTSKLEADQREVNRLREKISSIEEEVSSLKRQQTQLQQEMEAKQRQLEQQIEFLLSQLQLRRDPPT
jgi:molecular chaperone GrpE (heat shock protein)